MQHRTPDNARNETAETDAADETRDQPDDAGGDDGAAWPDLDPDAVESAESAESAELAEPAEPADGFEGPRRRARRERAERRAAQARAEAIEQARREAKRRALRRWAEPKPSPRGSVRGLKLVLIGFLVAILLTGMGLLLYFTPMLAARSINVLGIEEITRDEVVEVAAVRLGTPLLQIDTGEVADRVATIRRVASARVQREYPSALRVIVVERVPVVVKDFADGPHLFDKDGVDFATAPPPPMLPYLDVDNPSPTDPPTVAALRVMVALAPEVVGQVSRVAAPSVASITLTLTDGRTVVWGSTDRTAEKAEKLAALLTQPGHVYDVSSPDLPTVR